MVMIPDIYLITFSLHHTLGSLKQQKFLLLQFWRHKS